MSGIFGDRRLRAAHVDPLENSQVVVERDGAHGDGEDHQPEQVCARGRGEDGHEEVELAEEAGEGRDSGQRQDEDGECRMRGRAPGG